MPLRRIAILGGSDPVACDEHLEAARVAGSLLAEYGLTAVYGESGEAAGALGRLIHSAGDRAQAVPVERLAELADGFLGLPGGPGTISELFDVCLGGNNANEKPCGLLNTAGYYSDLLKTTEDLVVERFVLETQRGRVIVERDPAELLRAMGDFRPPETRRLPA